MKNFSIKYRIILLTFVFSLIFLFSCNKINDKYSFKKWTPNVIIPIANSTITIKDIFSNDSTIQTAPDSSLIFIFKKDSAFLSHTGKILGFPEQLAHTFHLSLGEVTLDTFSNDTSLTILQTIKYLNKDAADSLKNKLDGKKYVFPKFWIKQPLSLDLPVISNFNSVKLATGLFSLTIKNTLPVTIDTLTFEAWDKVNKLKLKTFNIYNLLPGKSKIDTIVLNNKSISNKLKIDIGIFSSKGSSGKKVIINKDQGLFFHLKASNLKGISGTAIIPNQSLTTGVNFYSIVTNNHSDRIYNLKISDADIQYNVKSQFAIPITLKIGIPFLIGNQQNEIKPIQVLPGKITSGICKLANANIDMTRNPKVRYSQIPLVFSLNFSSIGKLISFDSTDFINAELLVNKIKMDYVKGHIGKREINFTKDSTNVDLGIIKKLSGSLLFTNPEIIFNYSNSFGIPFNLNLSVLGKNKNSGQQIIIKADSIPINYPLVTGGTVYRSLSFNKDNSNVINFFALKPDKISYSGIAETSQNVNNIDFITANSAFAVDIKIKIPMNFNASNLVMYDTIRNLNISTDKLPIQDGILKIKIFNRFPLDLKGEIFFIDTKNNQILESIKTGLIKSGFYDSTGEVTKAYSDSLKIDINPDFLNNLSNSDQVIIKLTADSPNNNNSILYSTNQIKLELSLKARLKLNK